MSIDTLLNTLDKVKRVGENKWIARCPAHDDKNPSLAIKLVDDGKILIKCFSGCSVDEIVSSVGLSLSDLFPPKHNEYGRPKYNVPKFSRSEMFDRVVHESIILSIAVRQLLSGKPLTGADILSISKAEQLIDELVKEVRR